MKTMKTMKESLVPPRKLAAAFFAALLVVPCAHAQERIRVLASFSILADLVEKIGGEHVKVDSVLPRLADMHTYRLRPNDLVLVSQADVLVFNGLGFEAGCSRQKGRCRTGGCE